MDNVSFIAAIWMALALGASIISIRLGISVALAEIFVGIFGGNFLGLQSTPWIDFLAAFGSGLLTSWPAPRSTPSPFGGTSSRA